jgi:hypothetical protein
MSIPRRFVVLFLVVFALLGISFGLSGEAQAQADVPDWAESRTHAPPSDDRAPAGSDILDPGSLQRRPFSAERESSREGDPFSAQPTPKTGPLPPDGPENQVPLPGSGLVLLSAAGVGYAVRKLSREDAASDAA